MQSINQSVDIVISMDEMDTVTEWSSHFHQPSRPIYAVPLSHLGKLRDYFLGKNWRLLPTLTAYNIMYLCPRTEYDQRIDEYLTTADNFNIIDEYTNETLFDQVVNRIQGTLMTLRTKRKLTDEHYFTMEYVDNNEKKFDEIFFVPKSDNTLEPIIIFEKSPTKKIVDYLYKIINERYRVLFSSTNDSNGMEFIKALEAYEKAGLLKDTTLLACVQLEDVDRYVSHHDMIHALKRFMNDYMIDEDTRGLSHKTIIRLADMVLRSQFYGHEKKIYRKSRGGCQQIPFFRLLTNIYLMYLQNDLYDVFDVRHEIFCRYNNQIVCTWNESPIILQTMFGLFMEIRCDIPMSMVMDTKIQAMNMNIEINNGHFITKPYRSSPMELFHFFYSSGRPNRLYRRDFRSKLIKTVQMCSQIQDFDVELATLRQYCSLTGFPVDLVEESIQSFFDEFHQTTYSTWRASIMNIDPNSISPLCHKRSSSSDDDSTSSVKRIRSS